MCGITGIFNVTGDPISVHTIRMMTDVVRHRGPDDEGFWVESFIGFGHRRLAIIDLSPLARQPMRSDDGNLVITYNGEVYNFQNLRVELEEKGYRFRSKCDTEVVLKSYQHWGKECVHKFNGMFAFAVWDNKKSTLFLARDRYGIKPLYYYFKENIFIFASEIKSILQHPDISVKVSIPALNEYFSFQNIFSDLTLFEGIHILKPGHFITIKAGNPGSFHLEEYWDYQFQDEEKYANEKEYVEELNRLFQQAVNRQLISDVEVGSYLSGGIDSGAITSIVARNFKNLKTFTCGFDLSSATGRELIFDEREKAEYLSFLNKTEHYEVVLKAGDMERVISDMVWHQEDLRVGQSYPNFYISRLAAKFVKVVFSGTGGDELFAGYPWRYYRAAVNYDFHHYVEKYYKYWMRLIPDSLKPKFYQPTIYPEIWNYQTKDVFKSVLKENYVKTVTPSQYINYSLYFEIKTFMHGLLVVEDRLSMANGLETRVPFLDNDLVDFALKVPVKYKLKNLKKIVRINENEPGPKSRKYFERTNDGKIILRKVLGRYVPEHYAESVKQGFSAPDASWFKGDSINYIKGLLFDKKARIYDFIQPETAQRLMNEHFSGTQNRRLFIWSLLNFEWWLRIFKENALGKI